MRQGKHDMEVGQSEQFLFAESKPALARLRLTLRAMAITTRIKGDGRMTATGATIDVTSQRCGAAMLDSAQPLQLLETQPSAIPFAEAIPVFANNVGPLHGGPAHSGFRSFR